MVRKARFANSLRLRPLLFLMETVKSMYPGSNSVWEQNNAGAKRRLAWGSSTLKTKSPRAYCAGSANRGRCPAVKEDAITQKVTECCYRLRDRLFKKTMGKAYGTPASIEHDSSGSERETAPFSLLSAKYVLKLGISKSEFCRRTLLSEKTYERIKYGQLADRPKPETVMQFCVGLGLSL